MSLLFPPEFQLHKTYFHPAAEQGKHHCLTLQLQTLPATKSFRKAAFEKNEKKKKYSEKDEPTSIQASGKFSPLVFQKDGCSFREAAEEEEAKFLEDARP